MIHLRDKRDEPEVRIITKKCKYCINIATKSVYMQIQTEYFTIDVCDNHEERAKLILIKTKRNVSS